MGTICDEELDISNFIKDDLEHIDLTAAEESELTSDTRYSSENIFAPVFPIIPNKASVEKVFRPWNFNLRHLKGLPHNSTSWS